MTMKLPELLDVCDRIDLTHKLRNGMPVWPTHPKFEQRAVSSFDNGDIACNHSLSLSEHSGTHFDAPCHFIPGGRSIDEVPLDRFFGRMLTIDATDMAPDTEMEARRIADFEARHGLVKSGDAVVFSFGWAQYWEHPTLAEKFLRDWPGLSKSAAELLVSRGVRLVATDAMSIDRFGSTDFPAHRTLLAAEVLIGENFNNLNRVPPVCYLTTLPLPIQGGTGSPLRAIALVQRQG